MTVTSWPGLSHKTPIFGYAVVNTMPTRTTTYGAKSQRSDVSTQSLHADS